MLLAWTPWAYGALHTQVGGWSSVRLLQPCLVFFFSPFFKECHIPKRSFLATISKKTVSFNVPFFKIGESRNPCKVGGRGMGAESMVQKCARLHCPGTKTKRSQIAFVVICIVLSSGYLLGLHAQSLIETCGTRTGGTKYAPLKLKRPATRLHTLIERTPPLPRGFLMLL